MASMNKLTSVASTLRPLQGRDESGYYPRFLFRGQCKHYNSITPLIARRPSTSAVSQLYALFRDASIFATGIGGYRVTRRDGIGLFQHYGIPTPFIDFSGCLDVALFFALLGSPPGDDAVIYVLDRAQLPECAISFELDFLCFPFNEGGSRHRHLRQDAFVVGPAKWQHGMCHKDFDLLSAPFRPALSAQLFTVSADDRVAIANILSLSNDPIPRILRTWSNSG
jgi:FRG domain-containing protein